jgi:hypothetical protein
MALIAAPLSIPFFAISWYAPLAVIIIFKFMIPAFFICLAEFAFAHYFFARFKLLNFDYAMKEVSTKQDVSL